MKIQGQLPSKPHRKRRKKTLRQKRRNRLIAVTIAGALLIAAGVFIFVYLSGRETISQKEMGNATLPVVTCEFDGNQVNTLYGYTDKMDPQYMRETLYVLQDGFRINIQAQLYGAVVKNVDFSLIDVVNDNMVQTSVVTDFTTEDDVLKAVLNIDNMIDEEREYILELHFSNNSGKNIYYYTRLIKSSTTNVSTHLSYVKEFNSWLFDETKSDNLLEHLLQTIYGGYSSDYGNVDLYATLAHITWYSLEVTRIGDMSVNIVDINGDLVFFRVNYTLARNLNEINPEYYYVSEYYRTRLANGTMYLLSYERTMDERFVPTSSNMTVNTANLGIQSNKDIETKCSPDGNYCCFVVNGSLWMTDISNKQIFPAFTFVSDNTDIRQTYNQHDIKLLDVSDEGDARFIVFGYMNRGMHEGKSGVGLYTYDASEGKTVENAFIPSDLPYQVLKHTVGNLCYLNSEGDLYIMLDGSLYLVDGQDNSASLVTSNLDDNNCKVSANKNNIAWHSEGKINDADRIECMDFEAQTGFSVTCEENKAIKALGFLDNDLVYGQGNSGDILAAADGTEYLLMDKVFILDEEGNVQKEYSEQGYYFTYSETEYNRLIMHRVIKTDGTYQEADPFTVFATSLEEYPDINVYTETEEVRKRVVMLEFPNSMTNAGALKIKTSGTLICSDKVTELEDSMLSDKWNYFVYAAGELKALEMNAAEAINLAYETTGSVIDKNGAYFYRRGLRASSIEIDNETIQNAISEYKAGKGINVTGITMQEAMYFTAGKQPLVWEYAGNTYVIAGYSSSDSLMLYNINTNEIEWLSSDLAEEGFAAGGKLVLIQTET